MATNEPAVEVRGAHLPKIAEGGAASLGMAPAIEQIKGGPAPARNLMSASYKCSYSVAIPPRDAVHLNHGRYQTASP